MAGNSKLFSFIFLTIKASANNPKAKTFLPTILADMESGGSKILPLKEDHWTIGKLAGTNGLGIAKNIANQYFQINDTPVIPYPKDPQPSLDLKDPAGVDKVIINGLDNAYVTDFANYNYDEATATITADIKMQFNYWTNHPEGLQPGQKVTKLSLSTPFILTQNLCAVESMTDTQCLDPNGNPIQVVGDGTFTADITQLNFSAAIKINVKGDRAGLSLAITKLTLITTGDGAPQFKNVNAVLSNQSDFQDIISELITTFMSAPDASAAVFSQMQDSLNSAENIGAISNTLDEQIANLLDSRLGKVTGPLPSDEGQQADNKVDLYLFDRIRYSLNNPDSSWYVKTLLGSYQNPSLDPFKPQNLNVGSFDIFEGFALNDVMLSSIVITGFPNSTAPADKMILTPPTLNLGVLIGSLGSGATATANFSASYTGGNLNFGMNITVKSVSLNSIVNPSGDDASELVITFNKLFYQIPNSDAMQITISDQSGLGPVVQKVLNTPEVQNKIIDAVNSQLTSHLTAVGNEVTTIIKDLLTQQLGQQ